MRYDSPEADRAEEVRAVTISWARALWLGMWFTWGVALASALPGLVVLAVVLAVLGTSG